MSLILEALRKSEAQRRRGQPPDLFAELPPVAPRRSAALPPWLWPALALALLVAALLLARAWWNASAGSVQAVAADPAGAMPRAPSATPAGPAPVGPGSVGPASAGLEPAGRERAGAAGVPTAAVPTQAASPVPAVATRRPAAPAVASVQAAPIPAPVADTPPAPAIPAPAPVPASSRDPVAAPLPAIATASPSPPPAAASASATPGGTAPLLSLSDLSADERRQLPPLKMSMHLWSPDPARRFVILDGHRLVEGDRVGAAVVERIADDGVVLAWNGYRLRLPLP